MDIDQRLEKIDIIWVQRQLLDWFQRAGRDFPWRNTSDPYAILVAEKLLQQTQARKAVVDAYRVLLNKYPTPADLAEAKVKQLEDVIGPLGLVYRARELKTMAAELVRGYGGQVPGDLTELLQLTGVGSYGARAVLSFAFRKDVPIVDTNVARIFYRIFGISGPMPANPARKRSLLDLADSLIPVGEAREFNLALLDLGALICTPTSPACGNCPILAHCEHGQNVIEDIIPLE